MIGHPKRSQWTKSIPILLSAIIGISFAGCRTAPESATEEPDTASALIAASGIEGGLVVVAGCTDVHLLETLSRSGPYLIQCLDRNPDTVMAARNAIREKALYGPITASRLEGTTLPYVDSIVNLMVITENPQIPADEMARVAVPEGVVADIRNASMDISRSEWPTELDEWTHYLYDASNHAVSKDTVVGPPKGLRWTCGPEYARSHEHFSSVSAMVTTNGRVFYIIDEGPISSVWLSPRWQLVARDAFNGVKLWERPIGHWESQLRGFRSGPAEIGRRLIAKGDRVYVSLGYGEPVTVLDAPTGKIVSVLANTDGARELLISGGMLYVLADDMTADDHNKRKEWIDNAAPSVEVYSFPRETIPMYGKQRLVAIQTDTGEMAWKAQFDAPGEVMPATVAADDGKICYQTVSRVICHNAMTGAEEWRRSRPVAQSRFSWSTPTLVIHDDVVLTLDRVATDNADNAPPDQGSKWIMDNAHQTRKQKAEMVTFSLADGREMWRAPYFENYDTPQDIFVIDGIVWTGDLRHATDPGITHGRDLLTGEIVTTLPHNKELYNIQMGHHRCYRNKATVKWIMLGRDGIEFVDPKNKTGIGDWWVRGSCQYGIMPANGLIYAPQHSCACHPGEKLIGLNALSSQSNEGNGPPPLEKGPAYGDIGDPGAVLPEGEWPTYRRDIRRSGYQGLEALENPVVLWTKHLTPPITAPVSAAGTVWVAETEQHAIHALSAEDGKPVWSFIADGRIDSPPTIHEGICVFGTRNGFVYALRASDGALVWRFRAAPQDRRLFSYEQLESVWPVHGSVLVDDSVPGPAGVYFAAGRSSHLDGGIRVYALDVKSGGLIHQSDIAMEKPTHAEGIIRRRVLPDILSLQKNALWMRDLGFDRQLSPVENQLHLYAPGGFLDNTWWHRTYWVYGTTMLSTYIGWPLIGNVEPAGRLLAYDGGDSIYGYGRMVYRHGAGHVQADAADEYFLFAEIPPSKPLNMQTEERWWERKRKIKWAMPVPFIARSIILTPDSLLVGGGTSLSESADEASAGVFRIASRKNGEMQFECELPAVPVLDGMAMTKAGVFVSAVDGSLSRLAD